MTTRSVPTEPTDEMLDAAFAATVWPDLNRATSSDVIHALRENMRKEYKAMLAAAPDQPDHAAGQHEPTWHPNWPKKPYEREPAAASQLDCSATVERECSTLRAELEQERGNSKEWQRNYQESERQATEMMNMRDAQRRAKEAAEVKLSIAQDDFNTLESVYKIASELGISLTGRVEELQDKLAASEAREAALLTAARAVVWFDWSDNDSDAVAAINGLRNLVDAAREKEPDRANG